jgi:hemerythrin-like metal-binding protein
VILAWQGAFTLGNDAMDATHREFVALLNVMESVPKGELAPYFDRLLTHTQTHFETENETMRTSGFLSLREHEDDHNRILAEMMQMQRFAAKGMEKLVRAYVREKLPDWFATHAATMDTALALHLKSPATKSNKPDKSL